MWIKLLSKQTIDQNGTPTRFYPGDWVDVGRQTALYWITKGWAEKPGTSVSAEYIDYTSGIAVIGDMSNNNTKQITESFPQLEVTNNLDKPQLLFSETLIYNTKTKLRPELIHVGFRWLEKWQVVAPLFDYETLACHIGNEQDQIQLKEIIKETRVPIYNTGLLFVSRCEETQRLLDHWLEYNDVFTDTRLAFLAAVYKVKPLLLAVPETWCR